MALTFGFLGQWLIPSRGFGHGVVSLGFLGHVSSCGGFWCCEDYLGRFDCIQ